MIELRDCEGAVGGDEGRYSGSAEAVENDRSWASFSSGC